jgi:ubiquitin carboxyl-terminal hydrolase 14
MQNATVQCLGSIPELRKSLTRYVALISLVWHMLIHAAHPMQIALHSFTIGAASQTTPEGFPAVLGGLYRNLSTAGEALSPMLFITILRQLFPKFAERGHGGSFAQQDAEECWADIITLLKPRLLLEGDGSSKVIDRYLSGEVVTT